MKILGLDLGSKTLGIAMSDDYETIAFAKETFRFEQDDYDAAVDKTIEYIKQYNIKKVVLGLPKHMNGSLGERAEISMEFKDVLESLIEVEVILMDERLTTVTALNSLKNMDSSIKQKKEKVDQLAAQTILQDYLERQKNEKGQ